MMLEIGFGAVEIGGRVDTFAGAIGEPNARQFDVYGYPFLARKPSEQLRLTGDDLLDDTEAESIDLFEGEADRFEVVERVSQQREASEMRQR